MWRGAQQAAQEAADDSAALKAESDRRKASPGLLLLESRKICKFNFYEFHTLSKSPIVMPRSDWFVHSDVGIKRNRARKTRSN